MHGHITYTRPLSLPLSVSFNFQSCILNSSMPSRLFKELFMTCCATLPSVSRISTTFPSHHLFDEHEQHVRAVLEQRQDYGIAINQANSVFEVETLTFLDDTINKDACCPNPERVTAISSWLLPTTKKSLLRFLGMLNFYRRFIFNAAQNATL